MAVLPSEFRVTLTSNTRLVTTSTNLTVVKGGPTTLYSIVVSNPTAVAGFLKIYDKATAPAPASDHPVFYVPITASVTNVYYFGMHGIDFVNGISFATTNAIAENDNTNMGAVTDCHIAITYAADPVRS